MARAKVGKTILVEGTVQGVGFRPKVYRLAIRHGVDGLVRNVGGDVEIVLEGAPEAVESFIGALTADAFPAARIDAVRVLDTPPVGRSGFEISPSRPRDGGRHVMPDIGLCPECAGELRRDGRRHRHPFITCTECGPRFSVIQSLPYDRRATAMSVFPLCPECAAEYRDPGDRRFHAETICCNACGPKIRYHSRDADALGEEALGLAVAALASGGVVLVKGLGGYHLACSPFSGSAVGALRAIKGREAKPFAVMFRDARRVMEYCRVNAAERKLLEAPANPIVLLNTEENAACFAPDVLMGNALCGCFIPYTPLHALLVDATGPLVMTSANASEAPIIHDDAEACEFHSLHAGTLSGVLTHDRRIVRPVEDSVAAIGRGGTPQLLRRSRGFAPAALPVPGSPAFLAMGGDLKASFCLARGGNAHLSQYYGDLLDFAVADRYREGIRDLSTLLGIHPEKVVCDSHPGYVSSMMAHEFGLPVTTVQHHHAHIASVMAEHRLRGPVLGVAMDGTGYGDDGAVWGGEFFVCEGGDCRRVGHLAYTTLVGGDQAARDAGQTAACHLLRAGLPVPEALHPDPGLLAAAMGAGVGCAPSSSMGRLFDALAAILGLRRENRYEGECAVVLQQCAEAARAAGREPIPLVFALEETDGVIIADPLPVVRVAFERGRWDPGGFALGFHVAIAEMTAAVLSSLRRRFAIGAAAFSGGVFQNRLLLELCCDAAERDGFTVYVNEAAPPNDGGIALGQAYQCIMHNS